MAVHAEARQDVAPADAEVEAAQRGLPAQEFLLSEFHGLVSHQREPFLGPYSLARQALDEARDCFGVSRRSVLCRGTSRLQRSAIAEVRADPSRINLTLETLLAPWKSESTRVDIAGVDFQPILLPWAWPAFRLSEGHRFDLFVSRDGVCRCAVHPGPGKPGSIWHFDVSHSDPTWSRRWIAGDIPGPTVNDQAGAACQTISEQWPVVSMPAPMSSLQVLRFSERVSLDAMINRNPSSFSWVWWWV